MEDEKSKQEGRESSGSSRGGRDMRNLSGSWGGDGILRKGEEEEGVLFCIMRTADECLDRRLCALVGTSFRDSVG